MEINYHVDIKYSVAIRCFFNITLMFYFSAIAVGFILSKEMPGIFNIAALALSGLLLIYYCARINTFNVQIDNKGIMYREITTTTIPFNEIKYIKIAHVKRCLFWLHTHFEIMGSNSIILLGYSTRMLLPMENYIKDNFSSKIEYVDSIEDISYL